MFAKRKKMSEESATILDYLNEDCWHAVLQYVPVCDIVRTESVSQRWQEVVLRYLRGSEVVVACCNNWEDLGKIGKACPNITTLQLFYFHDDVPESYLHSLSDDFKCLQQLWIHSDYSRPITDIIVSQFIGDKALEVLEFSACYEVTGKFLNVINTSNLKKLVFDECRGKGVKAEYMVSAVERLGELTELKLIDVDSDVTEEMQAMLDKMPKLEQLSINSDIRTSYETIEPLSRLTRLKHLSFDFVSGDMDLLILMSRCTELRSLFLLNCQGLTSADACGALTQHGRRLTKLCLNGFYAIDDAGVLALIRGCPELTSLDISASESLTPALPRRAEAAWRETRPELSLTLDLSNTILEDDECLNNFEGEELEEMKRLFEETQTKYPELLLVFEPISE